MTGIPEPFRPGSVEEVRLPSLLHSQRGDQGECLRKVQSNSEKTHIAIFYETSDDETLTCFRTTRLNNYTHHRSIGIPEPFRPGSVNPSNQEQLWQRLYGDDGQGVPTFRVADRMRIRKAKYHFVKYYMANWSEELFTIHEVRSSDPLLYRLTDDFREMLDGSFYETELQKVRVRKVKLYRVESELQRRKVGKRTEALVKWFGYPSN